MMLKVALILVWIVTQLLALIFGGFALLGASYGQPGTSAIGAVILVAPTVLAIAGLLIASRARDPAMATAALAVPIAILVLGAAALVLSVVGARPS